MGGLHVSTLDCQICIQTNQEESRAFTCIKLCLIFQYFTSLCCCCPIFRSKGCCIKLSAHWPLSSCMGKAAIECEILQIRAKNGRFEGDETAEKRGKDRVQSNQWASFTTCYCQTNKRRRRRGKAKQEAGTLRVIERVIWLATEPLEQVATWHSTSFDPAWGHRDRQSRQREITVSITYALLYTKDDWVTWPCSPLMLSVTLRGQR